MGLTAAGRPPDRKRYETRDRLATAARRLFVEHGFTAVTLAQVGAAIGVSARTVTKYFPAKEELYFADQPPVDERLLRVVRDRPPGESAYEAVRHAARAGERFPGLARTVRERPPGETVYEAIERYRARPRPPADSPTGESAETTALARVFTGSDKLRSYVDEQFDRQAHALARILAGDTAAAPGDPLPGVVASALLAPLRWVFVTDQESLAAGTPPDEVSERRADHLDRAYRLLAASLADYARRG